MTFVHNTYVLEVYLESELFSGNNNYFLSYLVRTVLEILIASVLLVWMSTQVQS